MRQRGFTLLELVIVVAIVGILASAALPLARWGVKRNREMQLQQNLRILRIAIDRYHDAAQAGLIEVPEGASGYPPDLKTLVEGVPLIAQMPPVAPAAADEYAATGPGLTGGLQSQIEESQVAGQAGAAGLAGTPNAAALSNRLSSANFGSSAGGGRLGLGAQSAGGSRMQQGRLGLGNRSGAGTSVGGQGSRLGAASGIGLGQNGAQPGLGSGGAAQVPAQPLLGPDGQPIRLMFLRRIPVDPMTGKADWGIRCYGEPPADRLWCGRDVFDVYSKALGDAIDGTKYRDW